MEEQKITKKLEEVLQETIEGLMEKMAISCEIEIKKVKQEGQEDDLICNIKTEDSNYLIGQYGVNLQALQHIARVIVRKKTESRSNFILDVNSYRQEKNQSVVSLAKATAEKVMAEGKEIVLRPMSAYERRLVHMELLKEEKVKTESIGEGEDRRVVIKIVEEA